MTGWNFLTYFINIVVPGTVPAFAAGLRKLMTDVDSRESLGNSARDYCAAHYSRARILEKWENVIKGFC